MADVIYAIKVGCASYGNLEIWDVKIGKTANIKATISQYRRSHGTLEILNLWEVNKDLTTSECEGGVHQLAEKYAYERKSEKFIFLQNSYKNFEENTSKLLNKITEKELERGKSKRKTKQKQERYIGRKPKFVKFQSNTYKVNTWREVLQRIAKIIHSEKKDFDRVLDIKGRKRVYFSKDNKGKGYGGELVQPIEIPNTPYYFEGNISANRTMVIVDKLLELFNYQKTDLEIGYY